MGASTIENDRCEQEGECALLLEGEEQFARWASFDLAHFVMTGLCGEH